MIDEKILTMQSKCRQATKEKHMGHCSVLSEMNLADIERLYIGDSILERFEWKDYNKKHLFPNSFFLAKGGDKVQNLIWRLENLNFTFPNVKSVVLCIGTNNIGHDSSPTIAKGVERCIELILEKIPDGATIYLLPIYFYEKEEPSIKEYNDQLSLLSKRFERKRRGPDITCPEKFWKIIDEYDLRDHVYEDHIHLNEKGYDIFYENLMRVFQ